MSGSGCSGQLRDSESGLDYFNSRYFSSALGRFTSPDPANTGANLYDPQTWNAYAYVRGNPLTLVDPSGMALAPACDPFCDTGQTVSVGLRMTDPDYATDSDPYASNWYISFQYYSSMRLSGSSGSGGGANGGSSYGATLAANKLTSTSPPKNGTQQQQPSSLDWSKVGKAALSCAADHYGLKALAGGAGALGLPVPKSWLGLAPGFAGASENTSVAGAIGFKLFGAAEPRIGVRLLGTTRLFGVIGRAAPGASAALFAYDAAAIGYCTYQAVK